MIFWRISILLVWLTVALPVQAVSISEIAWMGSTSSANHEWIELYNSNNAVVVDGWTLTDGMNLSITLAGIIPGGSYVILERNRSDGGSVVSGGPFLNYTGALVNTGATLTLRRADGSIVDQVVGGDNWQNIGGDNTTKETAQYTSGGWITALATPGAQNAVTGSVQTSGGSGTAATSVGRSPTVLTGTAETLNNRLSYAHLPWELSLAIAGPSVVQVNQPVLLRAEASGLGPTHLNSLQYTWNMGDLTTLGTNVATHTYQYPGTYIVTLYATFAKREAVAIKNITVLPTQFSLARVANNDLQIYNDAAYDVDMSGFRLRSAGKTIVFPPRSFLPARGTLTVPVSRIGNPAPVFLYDAADILVANTEVSMPMVEIAQGGTVAPPPSRPEPTFVTSLTTTTPEPSAFRFATTAATETGDEISEIDESFIMEAERDEDPLASQSPLPRSATWPYGLLVLLLGGAILLIILMPTHKHAVTKETLES